jgi:hypothetical protein
MRLLGPGLLLIVTTALEAQVIRGTVRADSGDVPVAGAEVLLEGTEWRSRTDRAGTFRLTDITPGSYRLLARAVGYRPLAAQAIVAAGDTIDLDLVLTKLTVELPPIEVTADKPEFRSAVMRGFDDRRRAGLGRFFTRKDLEKWDHGTVTAALRGVSGLRLVPLPCTGGYAVATNREGGGPGAGVHKLVCTGIRGTLIIQPACYLSVYVDGVRIWSWGDQPPPDMEDLAAQAIEGIEIYRGPSELPAQYQTTGSSCGAVLFWTRTGEGKH